MSIDRVSYDRQADYDNKLNQQATVKSERITNVIIGCGGIGYWYALINAMLGNTRFVLLDGDTISSTNLNRLPVSPRMIGSNKAHVLAKHIKQLRPCARVLAIKQPFNEVTSGTVQAYLRGISYVHVIDCTDDARAQMSVYKWYKDNVHQASYTRYVKLAYEGEHLGVYRNFDVWLNEDTYQPGYNTLGSNVISSMLASILGLFSLRNNSNEQPDVHVDSINLLEQVINGQVATGNGQTSNQASQATNRQGGDNEQTQPTQQTQEYAQEQVACESV